MLIRTTRRLPTEALQIKVSRSFEIRDTQCDNTNSRFHCRWLVAYGEMTVNAKRVGGYKEVGVVCQYPGERLADADWADLLAIG